MTRTPDHVIALNEIADSFVIADDLPRPQWDVIESWINDHVNEERRDAAWSEAACQWLERLSEHLPGRHWLDRSPNFVLLTPQNEKDSEELLQSAEALLSTISSRLDRLCALPRHRKLVLLLFDHADQFYTYVCHFFPEGKYGGAIGMHIHSGYPHIVLRRVPDVITVLAHELTHAALEPLSLPLWIEEGIAQIIEQIAMDRQWFTIDHDRADRQKVYWRKHGLQRLWSGDAFAQAGEGQSLAYQLAEILVRNIMADDEDRFLDFLQHAEYEDGGEQAAQQYLGTSLGICAERFLGEGPWAPASQ